MACEYSPGIADLVEDRWATYDYSRQNVTEMVARISRPGNVPKNLPVTQQELVFAEQLIAAGCE